MPLSLSIKRDWRSRISPLLKEIAPDIKVEISQYGLLILVSNDSPEVRQSIEDVFVAANADTVPYRIAVSGGVMQPSEH